MMYTRFYPLAALALAASTHSDSVATVDITPDGPDVDGLFFDVIPRAYEPLSPARTRGRERDKQAARAMHMRGMKGKK